MSVRHWSEKQQAIFAWFAAMSLDVVRHLIVRARAGTGKTTTIVEALKYVPSHLQILVCAFNKSIEIELKSRLSDVQNVTVKTMHALGLACVKRFWSDVRVNFSNERETDLAQQVCGMSAPDTVKKLVAKLVTKAREMAPHATKSEELRAIAIQFECEPDDEWVADGFDLEYVCAKAVAALEVAATVKPVRTGIDGADMIFLPVRNGWLRKMFDGVVIDEGQDMTLTQIEIARGVCRGPIVTVGDDKQAIYAFRGADSESLDRLKTELTADELPLNTTYRCGKAIVREAQRYVPDFEAGEENADGSVSDLDRTKLIAAAGPGDFVLSRTNAPLVAVAMSLLRAGKRTRIAGRDIGKGLVTLVRKLKARSVPDFLAKLSTWQTREEDRLLAKFKGKGDLSENSAYMSRLDAIRDQAEMLSDLADAAPSINEIETRIEALFTDDGLGQAGVITCSSVHRSKGLEANRVFVLAETLRYNNQEEKNIVYVAITRAKHELVYVTGR